MVKICDSWLNEDKLKPNKKNGGLLPQPKPNSRGSCCCKR